MDPRDPRKAIDGPLASWYTRQRSSGPGRLCTLLDKPQQGKRVAMNILDLTPDDKARIEQVAQLLVDAFREHYPEAWPDLASGQQEALESLGPGRISRVAIDDQGLVLGWIGGIPQYNGHV
jgi:hypothetical protein